MHTGLMCSFAALSGGRVARSGPKNCMDTRSSDPTSRRQRRIARKVRVVQVNHGGCDAVNWIWNRVVSNIAVDMSKISRSRGAQMSIHQREFRLKNSR